MSEIKVVRANPQQTIVPANQFVGPVFPQPSVKVKPLSTPAVKVAPLQPQGQITKVGQAQPSQSIRPANTPPAIDSMYKALTGGANPTSVLQEIYNQNKTVKPTVSDSIKKAVQSGYNHGQILDEIFKQNGFKPLAERQDALSALDQPAPQDRSGGFFSRLGGDLKERVGNVQTAAANKEISNPSFGFQVAGQLAGGVLDVGNEGLTSAFRSFVPKGVQTSVSSLGDKVGSNKTVQGLTEQYRQLKEKYPELVGNIEAGVNIASVAGLVKGPAKIGQIRATKAAKQLERIPGQIIQGGAKDVPGAVRTLSTIDIPKGVTYEKLVSTLDDKIAKVGSTVDTAYESARPGAISIKDLTHSGHNFVKDAVKQLSEYYRKTNNISGLREIKAIENKANGTGLTLKEVNQLAKTHGRELNGFNANGELASGLTRQAAENTRAGVKATARGLINDPVFESADNQLSELINTRDLVKDVAKKVNTLQQKIQTRGLGAKLGYITGQVLDKASLGSVKGLVNYFIPRGEGLKTLNALDLEKMLEKNLKTLQKLTDGKLSNTDFTAELEKVIRAGTTQKLLPAPSGVGPKVQIFSPINQPSKVITPGTEAFKGRKIDFAPKKTPLGLPAAGESTSSTIRLPSKTPPSVGTPFKGRRTDFAPKPLIPKPLQLPAAGKTTSSTIRLPSKMPSTVDTPFRGPGALSNFKSNAINQIKEGLSESVPGLYTTSKYTIQYTTKDGKKAVLKGLDRGEAGGWVKYLKENGIKFAVKTAGAGATAVAIKNGTGN